MNAIAPPPRKSPPTFSRHEHRSRAGIRTRGHGLPGYVRIQELPASFSIAWRWRYDVKWHAGSVATREEAEAIRVQIRAALARGEEPAQLPKYDARPSRDPIAVLSPEELAERRARLKQQLAPDAERCPRCHCLKPCHPCIDELTREIRSARRGE